MKQEHKMNRKIIALHKNSQNKFEKFAKFCLFQLFIRYYKFIISSYTKMFPFFLFLLKIKSENFHE